MVATAIGGGQAVEKHLKSCGFKRTVDVLVLYLGWTAIPLTCSVISTFPHKRLNVPLTGCFTLEGMLGTASPQKEKTRPMQTLAKVKDLFHNPLAQDPGYWLNVIHLLPSVQLLDRKSSEVGNKRNKKPFENPEDAVSRRAMARSLMEFSYVDWNKVATSRERRLENRAAAEGCKKLTVRFR